LERSGWWDGDCWREGANGINLGVAGFALTVIIFYFSDVMDKLGRSASLIGLEYCSCSADGRWSERGGNCGASRRRNAMSASRKGIILAVVQLAIVASLAAKYAIDSRAVSARLGTDSSLRSRTCRFADAYLSVRLRVDADRVFGAFGTAERNQGNFWGDTRDIYLHAGNGHLVANPASRPTGLSVTRWKTRTGEVAAVLSEPVAYFIPEHAIDPSRRLAGEELWVEVTGSGEGSARGADPAGSETRDTFTPLDIK